MISKTNIQQNLFNIRSLYNSEPSLKRSLFYSKLALLELCGWIEESMDEIIIRCARRYLKSYDNLSIAKSEIVKKTYGFNYKIHFRKMLMKTIGIINLERLEKSYNQSNFSLLKSNLDSLKTCRDSEAHTHIKGTTHRIDSPSVTIDRFFIVYEGLKDIEQALRKFGR